jgi:hypothetical protein
MLTTRLVAGALLTIGGGYIASITGDGNQKSAAWFGGSLLALSAIWHYHIWDKYPVWYHLVFLGYIFPLAILGGSMKKWLVTPSS